MNYLQRLTALDWADQVAIHDVSCEVLAHLAEANGALEALLERLPQDCYLLSLCEHYDILDKLVLFADQHTGVRVRLHVFLPGYYDRPHNHRWSYSSLILQGSYRHYLYGTDEHFTDSVDVRGLLPLMVREERAGSAYTLHHSMVHSVVAEPYTVSLVVRGPAVKDRFLVTDKQTSRTWWQYGAKHESPAERAAKAMSAERLAATISLLARLRMPSREPAAA
jgi:hypothetical protein